MSNNKENFKKNLTGIDFYFYLCRDVFKKNLNIMKDDNITLPELELPQLRPRPSTLKTCSAPRNSIPNRICGRRSDG